MLTGVAGLVRNIRTLTHPMEFEGISGTVFADRIGKADIRIGSESRELDCYISDSMGDETLVPGNAFGEGDYSFKGKDRMLYLKNETTKEKSAYPRDIVVASGAYSPGFLQALSGKGKVRQHTLFPMPDSAFVWHGGSRALVQTRAQKNAPQKAESIRPPTPEPEFEGLEDSDAEPNPDLDPIGQARQGDIVGVELHVPIAASSQPHSGSAFEHPQSGSAFEQPQSGSALGHPQSGSAFGHPQSSSASGRTQPGAISAQLPADPQRSARAAQIIKQIFDFHELHGHRAMDQTVREYEWVHGKRVPAYVVDNLPRCPACDLSKITSAPYAKKALVPTKSTGERIVADTIVSMPTSLSGYKHVSHMMDVHSNYGVGYMSKTKVASRFLLYFLKRVKNLTGRDPVSVGLDSGEYVSSEVQQYLEKVGAEMQLTLASTHQGQVQPIERRHRVWKEALRAMRNRGGGNDSLWEFVAPQVDKVLQLTVSTAALRQAGRPGPGKQRPLTPFEMMVCHGQLQDLSRVWRDIHPMFVRGVGYIEGNTGHGNRGFIGVYFGPIPGFVNVANLGHYVLCLDSKRVKKVRTFVSHPGVYPLVAQPAAALEPSPSGGEVEEKKDNRPHPSGKEKTGKIAVDKFPPGTIVMTTGGPAVIQKSHGDGDYAARFGSDCEPQEVCTVHSSQFWLPEDWPDYVYDHQGKRLDHTERKEASADDPRLRGTHKGQIPSGKSAIIRTVNSYRVYEGGKAKRLEQPPPLNTMRALRAQAARPSPAMLADLNIGDLSQTTAVDVERCLPKHYHQSFGHPLRSECEKGEIRELQDCINKDVWLAPVDIEPDWLVIGLMWVYAVKPTADHMFQRVRSRITLMGNQERTVLSPLEAYAPVAQVITMRLLVVLHMHIDGIIFRQLDVKNAYINEYMKRKVMCKMPPGYLLYLDDKGNLAFRRLRPGEKHPAKCLPLSKALYGGMECGRIFWEAWVDWHLNDGFQIIHEERCYLHKRNPSGSFIKIAYHVDDNGIVALGDDFYADYLTRLTARFDVTEGPLSHHLGMDYEFDRAAGTCLISQHPQIIKLLKEFGMEQCNSASTPAMSGAAPSAMDSEDISPEDEQFDMECFVGHCNYIHMCSRPDIGQAIKPLSRATKKGTFGSKHVLWAKHILRYLKGTAKRGLLYATGFPLFFQIFTDASHASCVDTRRSITSIGIKLGGNTVYWKTSFTSIVSHSSTESELMALDVGATNGQCLRWLLQSMGGPIQGTIQIFVDNQGAINISTNPIQSGRNLHVHARYFYVRDLVYDEHYALYHLPTEMQVADVGCTFKGGPSFLKLRDIELGCARVVHDGSDVPQWEIKLI